MSDPKLDSALEALAANPVGAQGLDAMQARLQAELGKKQRPWWQDVVMLSGLNLALCAVLLAISNQLDAPWTPWRLCTCALLLLVCCASVIAIHPRTERWGLAVVGAVVVVAMGALLAAPVGAPEAPLMAGTSCAGWEVGASLVPLVVSLMALRRFAFSAMRALVAGLSAGAAGMVSLHLHCPWNSLSHLVFSHILPWWVLAGAFVLLRSRMRSTTFAP